VGPPDRLPAPDLNPNQACRPIQNSVFYVFCFDSSGLLEDVTTPQYSVEFKNYKGFKSKRVARLLVTYPEPGVTIEANITELGELANVDESVFTISQPTPKEMQLQSVSISEVDLRNMVTPESRHRLAFHPPRQDIGRSRHVCLGGQVWSRSRDDPA